MRGVKPLMIGRLIFTWLWPVLWLVTLPAAQAGAVWLSSDTPAALVSSAEEDDQCAPEPMGVLYRSVSRATRRFDSPSASDDTSAVLWLFRIEVARSGSAPGLLAGSAAPPGLANNWQFHWRTALNPRAPSFVS